MGVFADDDEDIQERAKGMLKTVEKDIVRNAILETKQRIDGRDLETVRPIQAEVGILPRAHGSALFTRGETQGLVTATLGTGQDEQIIDALEGEYREHFLLHYNFPPYSVGEASFCGLQGVAKSVMGSSLGGRYVHSFRTKRNFPTQCALCRRLPIQWFIVDGDRLWHISLAYGCGSSIAPALRGYCNGVDKRGRTLCSSLRYSR